MSGCIHATRVARYKIFPILHSLPLLIPKLHAETRPQLLYPPTKLQYHFLDSVPSLYSLLRFVDSFASISSPESFATSTIAGGGRVRGEDHGLEEQEGKKSMVRCFSLGSVLILAALAASMILLPLMLPPLPPPPLVLLFFPVGIMAALMLLAFSPSEANRNAVVYSA